VFTTDLIRLELLAKTRGIIGFVTTSKLQSRVLQHVLNVPALFVEEPLDTYYSEHIYKFKRDTSSKNINFYGYSNSIERTSSHLAFPLNELANKFVDNLSLTVFSNSLPPSFKKCSQFKLRDFKQLVPFCRDNFSYVILSDIAADLNVATMAKSPNKLLSAFQLGMMPIIPSGSLMEKKLPENYPFKFECPLTLTMMINHQLQPVKDASYMNEIRDTVLTEHQNEFTRSQQKLKVFLRDINIKRTVRLEKQWPNKAFYSVKDSLHELKNSIENALRF
jgi:hypothetical protein